jgi:deoxyadenosine/deoxycytidine kinase
MTEPAVLKVFVVGNIGCGKSTFLEDVKEVHEMSKDQNYIIMVVSEPLKQVEKTLAVYYADPKRYSFLLQTVFFTARVNSTVDAEKRAKQLAKETGKHIIMLIERSPDCDQLFAKVNVQKGMMSELEYDGYNSYIRTLLEHAGLERGVTVYIRPTLDACITRKFGRGREYEKDVPRDYMAALHEAHDATYCWDGTPETTFAGGIPVIHLENADEFDPMRRSTSSYSRFTQLVERLFHYHGITLPNSRIDSPDYLPADVDVSV